MIAALLIGLLGSWHCVLMCGPIALTVPVNRRTKTSAILGYGLYHLGRVMGYASIGLLIGKLGHLFSLAALQREVALLSGVFILAWVFIKFGALKIIIPPVKTPALISSFRAAVLKHYHRTSPEAQMLIGMANAFLPCGLVFIAASLALNSSSMYEGALIMAIFGAGTIPTLLLLQLVKNRFEIARKLKDLSPYVLSILAVLLILRGSQLNIPLLSPVVSGIEGFMHICLP